METSTVDASGILNATGTTAPHDVPRFVHDLLRKANAIGITEEELSRQLSVSHSYFSRWKRGLRWTPDPRIKENKDFYLRVAKFLGKGLGEILSEVLFLDKNEENELKQWVFESIELAKQKIKVPELSTQAENQIRLILLNLPSREDYAEVLAATLRTYITSVLKEEWIEDPLSLVTRGRDAERAAYSPSAHA